jgi:hypothetical protein
MKNEDFEKNFVSFVIEKFDFINDTKGGYMNGQEVTSNMSKNAVSMYYFIIDWFINGNFWHNSANYEFKSQ